MDLEQLKVPLGFIRLLELVSFYIFFFESFQLFFVIAFFAIHGWKLQTELICEDGAKNLTKLNYFTTLK